MKIWRFRNQTAHTHPAVLSPVSATPPVASATETTETTVPMDWGERLGVPQLIVELLWQRGL
ncbi:MAG: hypothetical protein RR317_06620, partial [Bilophila sp.]